MTIEKKILKGTYFFKVDENLYTDRESQLAAIEKTFEDVKQPLKQHYR